MRTKKQIRAIIHDSAAFEDRINNKLPIYDSTQEQFEHDKRLFRQLIDELDDEIAQCLQLRQRIVDVLHLIKEEQDEDIKDPIREDQIKDRLIREYPEMQETIETLYDHIFNNPI